MPEPDAVNTEAEPPVAKGARTDRAARRVEIADRRRQMTALLLRRIPQREIARLLKVSTGTVSEDMKAVRREWQVESQTALEHHIAHELAILNNDERELRLAMLTYGNNIEARLHIYDRVMKVMIERRKLLGLDAPIRLELARAEAKRLADEFDLDEAELIKMAEEIVAGHR